MLSDLELSFHTIAVFDILGPVIASLHVGGKAFFATEDVCIFLPFGFAVRCSERLKTTQGFQDLF